MLLTHLSADRLRNLREVDLALPPGLTVVHGENGHGKSSVLEAIYLLGTGRSFRTRRLDELVAWSGGPLRVGGSVTARTGEVRLAVRVEQGNRRLAVGSGECDLEAYLGRLSVVDLTAERMLVLRGSPQERRRFLDRGLVSLEPRYLRDLGAYRRVLQQRNTLLRRGEARSTLDAWNDSLLAAAGRIYERRREFGLELAERAAGLASSILGRDADLEVVYRPSPAAAAGEAPDRFVPVLGEALAASRERDLAVGHTTVGPHRDDLLIRLDGVDLRTFGSAGQQRAAMIILKLARSALMREARGEPPVFLMDDFDSDLDETRAQLLASFLDEGGFQAVVATSKRSLAERLTGPVHRVLVEAGVARAA